MHFYAHAMRTRITQVHPQDPSALSKCIPTWSNGVHFGHDGSLVSWEALNPSIAGIIIVTPSWFAVKILRSFMFPILLSQAPPRY